MMIFLVYNSNVIKLITGSEIAKEEVIKYGLSFVPSPFKVELDDILSQTETSE